MIPEEVWLARKWDDATSESASLSSPSPKDAESARTVDRAPSRGKNLGKKVFDDSDDVVPKTKEKMATVKEEIKSEVNSQDELTDESPLLGRARGSSRIQTRAAAKLEQAKGKVRMAKRRQSVKASIKGKEKAREKSCEIPEASLFSDWPEDKSDVDLKDAKLEEGTSVQREFIHITFLPCVLNSLATAASKLKTFSSLFFAGTDSESEADESTAVQAPHIKSNGDEPKSRSGSSLAGLSSHSPSPTDADVTVPVVQTNVVNIPSTSTQSAPAGPVASSIGPLPSTGYTADPATSIQINPSIVNSTASPSNNISASASLSTNYTSSSDGGAIAGPSTSLGKRWRSDSTLIVHPETGFPDPGKPSMDPWGIKRRRS